jgi:hypothetical protein
MAITLPPTDPDTGALRYFTSDELALIDLKRRGVSGEGDHIRDQMGPDGSGSTRKYNCAWDERYAAAFMLTGYAESYTDTDGKARISRLLPDSHPNGLIFNWVCTKVSIDPFAYTGVIDSADFGQSVPRFKRAELEATYEQVPFKLYDDAELAADEEFMRYVTLPGHPGADVTTDVSYVSLPGGSQSYTTGDGTSLPAGRPIFYSIGLSEPLTKKKLIWRRVPIDLWGPGTLLYNRVKGDGTPANRPYLGAINLTDFFGHPPLALKLDGIEERLLPDASGLGYAWDLTFVFQEKDVPYGHLGFYFATQVNDGSANNYYQILAAGNTTTKTAAALAALGDQVTLFPIREFANLLIVGAV